MHQHHSNNCLIFNLAIHYGRHSGDHFNVRPLYSDSYRYLIGNYWRLRFSEGLISPCPVELFHYSRPFLTKLEACSSVSTGINLQLPSHFGWMLR